MEPDSEFDTVDIALDPTLLQSAVIKLQGDDGGCVDFPAAHSPQLAFLMTKPDKQLAHKQTFVVAKRSMDGSYRCPGPALDRIAQWYAMKSAHDAQALDRQLHEYCTSATMLLQMAYGCHILKLHEMSEKLAFRFGAIIKNLKITVEKTNPESLLQYSNSLRQALSMPQRKEIPEHELCEISEYFCGRMNSQLATVSSVSPLDGESNDIDLAAKVKQKNAFVNPEWQKDEEVTQCPDCKSVFSNIWMIFRSHCRVCGQVKCRSCVKHEADPRYARRHPKDAENAPLKCCYKCHELTDHSSFRFFLCSLLTASGLNVLEIASLQLIDDRFIAATHMVLNDYRQLLYASSTQSPMTPERRGILRASASLIVGHPQLLSHLFRVVDFSKDDPVAREAVTALKGTVEIAMRKGKSKRDEKPPISHWRLLCTRACSNPLLDLTAVEILFSLNSCRDTEVVKEARRSACDLFVFAVTEPMKGAWVPVLLDFLHLQPSSGSLGIVREILEKIGKSSPTVWMQIYREILTRKKIFPEELHQLFDTLRSDVEKWEIIPTEELHRLTAFVDLLDRVPANLDSEVAAQRALYDQLKKFGLVDENRVPPDLPKHVLPKFVPTLRFPYAFDPRVTISGIYLAGIKIHKSKLSPVEVPLLPTLDPATNTPLHPVESLTLTELGKYLLPILYKREDVRRDYVVCNVVSAFEEFFRSRKERVPLIQTRIARYRVLPVTANAGIIEMVRGASSVEAWAKKNVTAQHDKEFPITAWVDRWARGAVSSGPVALPKATATTAPPPLVELEPTFSDSAPAQGGNERHTLEHREDFRKAFIDSAKFYSFAMYMLGIGDRHRANVLLCDSGEYWGSLCHIDFGFILGDKTSVERMSTSNYVRYDPDLKSAIETAYQSTKSRNTSSGSFSTKIDRFLVDTSQLLIAFRPHLIMLQLLLRHLIIHGIAEEGATTEFLVQRAFVGLSDQEAANAFIKCIEDSFGKHWLQDKLHDVGQEGITSVRSWLPTMFGGSGT